MTTNKTSAALQQKIANVKKWPRKTGKADYLRFLQGERLTRAEAIKAKCFECVTGEDTAPCIVSTCPLTQYCPWNASENETDGGIGIGSNES
jgi:hypothetical protein